MSAFDCVAVPDRIVAFRTVDTLPLHFAATVDTFVPSSRRGDLTYENTRSRNWDPHSFGLFAVRPGRLDIWRGPSMDQAYFRHAAPYDEHEFQRFSRSMAVPYAYTALNQKWPRGEETGLNLGIFTDQNERTGQKGPKFIGYGLWIWDPRKPPAGCTQEEQASLLRSLVAAACPADVALVDSPGGGPGFSVEACGGSGRIEVDAKITQAARPYPASILISGFGTAAEALGRLREAAAVMPDPPSRLSFSSRFDFLDFDPVRDAVLSIQPRWSYTWNAFYKVGFDPFARPRLPKGVPVLRYPVYRKDPPDHGMAHFELQIDVVHTRDESFLEFQTTLPHRVGKYIDKIGRKCEVWKGPFAERWGL